MFAAEACNLLADEAAAARIYPAMLKRWHDTHFFFGGLSAAFVLGPTQRLLGDLLRLMGRESEALQRYEESRALCERVRAAPFLALSLSIESGSIENLAERLSASRLVLLGSSTDGTSEFYRMRARITQALLQRHGFDFVATDTDLLDTASMNTSPATSLSRRKAETLHESVFPSWKWKNREHQAFSEWLRLFQEDRKAAGCSPGFHGLDRYNLAAATAIALRYLDTIDGGAARKARERFSSLTPWQKDPSAYTKAAASSAYQELQHPVVALLETWLAGEVSNLRRTDSILLDDEAVDALLRNASHFYRAAYFGGNSAWNLRCMHLFQSLQSLLERYGARSRGVVWMHNALVGDASWSRVSPSNTAALVLLPRVRSNA